MKPLRCPNCDAELDFVLEYTGGSHSEHRDLTGVECENWDCGAKWDRFGNPTEPSKREASDDPAK